MLRLVSGVRIHVSFSVNVSVMLGLWLEPHSVSGLCLDFKVMFLVSVKFRVLGICVCVMVKVGLGSWLDSDSVVSD